MQVLLVETVLLEAEVLVLREAQRLQQELQIAVVVVVDTILALLLPVVAVLSMLDLEQHKW